VAFAPEDLMQAYESTTVKNAVLSQIRLLFNYFCKFSTFCNANGKV